MKTLLFLTVIIGTILGCEENQVNKTFNGTYSGQFIHGTTGATVTSDSQVSFNGNNYSSTKGSGTYEVLENNIVQFKDVNFWTADFDWNTILKGRYNYELKGDSLIMTKLFELVDNQNNASSVPTIYQYRLKVQN
jgi:hypothetical protein